MLLIFFLLLNLIASSISDTEPRPKVYCETTKGPLTIEVYKEWAPLGAERFLTLVKDDFFRNIAFFRCVKGFLTQFGITEDPEKKHWHRKNIPDDPNLHLGIKKNYVSFAGGGPNTRSTQLFIAFEDLDFLGHEPWETPFGKVIEGQSTLDKLYKGYGDIPPFGNGPDQREIYSQGNKYIREYFPKTDFLLHCSFPVSDDPSTITQYAEEEERQQLEEEQIIEKISEEETTGDEAAEEQGQRNPEPMVDDIAKIIEIENAKTEEFNNRLRVELGRTHENDTKLIIRATFILLLAIIGLVVYIRYVRPDSYRSGKSN